MSTQQNGALSKEQVTALVVCMMATAKIDGLQPKEQSLIESFYAESKMPGLPAFDSLVATEAATALAAVRGDAAFAEQIILMCLMAGYADGALSGAERAHVVSIAKQLGVSDAQFDALLLQVKDSLIGSLAHLPVSESVAALVKEL
jgi:tellurite resistance protein